MPGSRLAGKTLWSVWSSNFYMSYNIAMRLVMLSVATFTSYVYLLYLTQIINLDIQNPIPSRCGALHLRQ